MTKKEAIKAGEYLAEELGDSFGDIHICKFKYGWDCATRDYFNTYKKRKIYHTIKPKSLKDVVLTKEDTKKLEKIFSKYAKKFKK